MSKPEKSRITLMVSPHTEKLFNEARKKDPYLRTISKFGEDCLLKALERIDNKLTQQIHVN